MKIELKPNNSKVYSLIRKCFPSWHGRKVVKIESRNRYFVQDYWDGGSRNYVCYVDLNTHQILSLEQVGFRRQEASNPFHLNIGEVELKPGIVAVENCIFCGKDLGIRIYCHPDDLRRFE